MSLIANIVLEDPILFVPTFERVPNAQCTFEDFHYVSGPDSTTRYVFFWWVEHCAPESFTAALNADPTVRDYRMVVDLNDRRLFRIVTMNIPSNQSLVFPFFREHDITTLRACRSAAGLELEARFPDRGTLAAFLTTAEEIAEQVRTRRLFAERSVSNGPAQWTEKQEVAVRLAYEEGYFATPRQATLDELASHLEVTPQTLSRHLRVGIEKLVAASV